MSVAALALAASACAIGTTSDDESATDASDTSEAPASTAAAVDTTASSVPEQLASADDSTTAPETETETENVTVPAGDPAADVAGCNLLDGETAEIELTNSLGESASYWLTVGFYDGSTRVGDTSVYINYVRPGEHVVEQTWVFDDDTAGASTCEVIDTDRTVDEIDAELLAAVSACEITGEDFVGDVEAALSVTNPVSELSDFSVTVAIVGADGVRQGTGNGYVEAVGAQETAPTDVFTTVDYTGDQQCHVVAVDSYDS